MTLPTNWADDPIPAATMALAEAIYHAKTENADPQVAAAHIRIAVTCTRIAQALLDVVTEKGWANAPGATDQDQADARTAIDLLRRVVSTDDVHEARPVTEGAEWTHRWNVADTQFFHLTATEAGLLQRLADA